MEQVVHPIFVLAEVVADLPGRGRDTEFRVVIAQRANDVPMFGRQLADVIPVSDVLGQRLTPLCRILDQPVLVELGYANLGDGYGAPPCTGY